MADENPYESPHESSPTPSRLTPGQYAFMFLLMVLMIPSTGIAFLVTCTTTAVIGISLFPDSPAGETAIFLGFLVGASAAAGVVYLFVRAMNRIKPYSVPIAEENRSPAIDAAIVPEEQPPP